MSIATRTTSMEQHIGNAYDKLDELGIDLVNVDKNLNNIAELLDGVYEDYPKIEENDVTEPSINNTKAGKMKIDLKGNTSQATRILPSEYTQLDYIESTGTQYIDLNETATINCEMGIDCYLPTYDSGDRFVMGCRKGGCNAIIGVQPNLVYQFGNMPASIFTDSIELNQRYKIVVNNTGCYVDGELLYRYSGSSSVKESSNHIKLFATSSVDESIEFYANTGTKMYSAYIKKNGVYTRNLIPCYRKSDNEIGMYDIVNNVFYTNAGTGAFTYGSVVGIPNPYYPQEIEVVTGTQEIDVCGKNLFKCDFDKVKDYNTNGTWNNNVYSWRGLSATINDDGTFKVSSGTTTGAFNFYLYRDETGKRLSLEAGTYTFSSSSCPATGNGNFIFKIYNSEGQAISGVSNVYLSGSTSSVTRTINESFQVAIYLQVSNGATETQKDYEIQIEKGSSSSAYTPYVSQSYPINLGSIELCKIGDYQDYIYKDNGKWYLEKQIGKIESYNGETITTDYISTTGQLTIGATIYYVLATLTTTEITDSELINQLNTLASAKSYDTITNITQNTNNLPFILNVIALKKNSSN